jgi:hypothetical protein
LLILSVDLWFIAPSFSLPAHSTFEERGSLKEEKELQVPGAFRLVSQAECAKFSGIILQAGAALVFCFLPHLSKFDFLLRPSGLICCQSSIILPGRAPSILNLLYTLVASLKASQKSGVARSQLSMAT